MTKEIHLKLKSLLCLRVLGAASPLQNHQKESHIPMAHILQVRQSGAVVALKLTLDKGTVAFHAEVFKWDDATSAPLRVGERRFTLPLTLYKNFTVNLLRERISGTLPPCLPGAYASPLLSCLHLDHFISLKLY